MNTDKISNEVDLKPGMSFEVIKGLPLKIMAIEEGYVMARYKGCFPFVESIQHFQLRIKNAKQNNPL